MGTIPGDTATIHEGIIKGGYVLACDMEPDRTVVTANPPLGPSNISIAHPTWKCAGVGVCGGVTVGVSTISVGWAWVGFNIKGTGKHYHGQVE